MQSEKRDQRLLSHKAVPKARNTWSRCRDQHHTCRLRSLACVASIDHL